MGEIVTIHNDLTDISLKGLSNKEIDLFMAICYKAKNKGTDNIEVSFKEIRELIKFDDPHNSSLSNCIEGMFTKLHQLYFTIDDDKKWTIFSIFNKSVIDKENKTIEIKVNEDFLYILNNLKSNFTSIDLQRIVSCKSSYSKNVYKKLCQYKYTGIWNISFEDFRKELSIPECYKQSNIDNVIIKKVISELEEYFPNLRCDKIYQNIGCKRGRPKIVGYSFKFKKFTRKDNKTKIPSDECVLRVSKENMDEINKMAKEYNMSTYDFANGFISENILDY